MSIVEWSERGVCVCGRGVSKNLLVGVAGRWRIRRYAQVPARLPTWAKRRAHSTACLEDPAANRGGCRGERTRSRTGAQSCVWADHRLAASGRLWRALTLRHSVCTQCYGNRARNTRTRLDGVQTGGRVHVWPPAGVHRASRVDGQGCPPACPRHWPHWSCVAAHTASSLQTKKQRRAFE
jgi:hypothetical protein